MKKKKKKLYRVIENAEQRSQDNTREIGWDSYTYT